MAGRIHVLVVLRLPQALYTPGSGMDTYTSSASSIRVLEDKSSGSWEPDTVTAGLRGPQHLKALG